MIGAGAARGRVFASASDRPGAALVVLSDGAWRQHFGADAQVLGRMLRVDGQPYEVVGVMPADFAFPERAQFWRLAPQPVPTPPLQVEGDLLSNRDVGYMDVIARLAPGVAAGEALAELRVLASTLAARHPDHDAGRGFDVEAIYDTIVGDVRQSLLLLFAAVGAVLLIACTNVASLMLARAVGRRRELAVRTALGAPRARLARQLIVESLVLALAGGVLGVLVSTWALEGLRALLPATVPRVEAIRLDLAAVGFAVVTSTIVGLAFGVAPAWMSTALASFDALRDGGRTSTGGRQWLRRGLVVGQVAVAAVLLTAAGVMGTSLLKLQRVDVGFRTEGVVTQQIVLPQSRYDRAAQTRFYQALTDRLNDDPRVAAAGVVFPSPFVSSQASATIRPRPAGGGRCARSRVHRAPGVDHAAVLRGDGHSAPRRPHLHVSRSARGRRQHLIVSRSFAERLLGGGDVIGRRLKFGDDEDDWYERGRRRRRRALSQGGHRRGTDRLPAVHATSPCRSCGCWCAAPDPSRPRARRWPRRCAPKRPTWRSIRPPRWPRS